MSFDADLITTPPVVELAPPAPRSAHQVERDAAIDALHQATAFYTAEPIVDQLLDWLDFPRGSRRLVDSSCGDGAFLARALERLLRREPQASDERLLDLVHGWEIHYFAAAEARWRLQCILAKHGWPADRAREVAHAMVTVGDFLTESPRGATWDCVAGNPPFLRYSRLPAVLREQYEQAMPPVGRHDMLHSFLDRCSRALRPGGEIALVTSDRWLFSKCAERLREELGRSLGLAHAERIDGTTSFARAKTRRAGTMPRVHPVAVVLKDAAQCARKLTRAPIYPGADDLPALGSRTLAAVARIRLAPWLGPQGIFVVDARTAATLPADVLVPAIDTDDIKGGVLTAPTRFAIRTESKVEPCAVVMAHLDRHLHRMPESKRRLVGRWRPPESFERMDLSQPSLLVPRIASTLRATRIPAGVLPIDHGISIVSADAATLDEIEAQLLRPQAEAWVRARAPRLEGGYFSLTTTLLRELPIDL